ncbi:signal peptidase I [Rhodoblastus sphagnicola]|uniref:Signal peptidase I n=1 Tax=Rhodoblastus sphagnicola TaxID=333368 RepID=A0A2S6NCU6_9HYPH|nr:signal peptidase I [Rhodoblastus sphagnicola]MBB4196286.1 signal peptidase I [Rhodoblastus sphagnicola]PPQ32428.1 signal peptidase I [Rhodoblastus sphagnicola]
MIDDSALKAAKKTEPEGLGETIVVILQALAIALVVRTFLFQPFNIPSGSMIPTLEIGDYLFVSKYSYGYSRYSFPFGPPLFKGRVLGTPPKRGDIVVFKLPRDNETDYIKRVIGLPGEKIEMKRGRLYINDEIVPREEIDKARTEDLYGHFGPVPTYTETLPGGVAHVIIEIQGDDGFNDNAGPFVVPPNHYFMMGDNRDNSTDSRVPPDQGGVGYVPFENIEGRAEVTFFSVGDGAAAYEFWRWPWTLRLGRMFHAVR